MYQSSIDMIKGALCCYVFFNTFLDHLYEVIFLPVSLYHCRWVCSPLFFCHPSNNLVPVLDMSQIFNGNFCSQTSWKNSQLTNSQTFQFFRASHKKPVQLNSQIIKIGFLNRSRNQTTTLTPLQTNMTMEKQPFEDVSPIKNDDFPWPC